jgi:hypothetical protein
MAESSLRDACLNRFLRYVTFDTQSNENSETYPSTAKQLVLLKHLLGELKEIGLKDAAMDDHGYVFATIPSTTKKANVPVVGFIAHVDTSPEMPGEGVKPIVHKNYQGQDLVLPDEPTAILKFKDNPQKQQQATMELFKSRKINPVGGCFPILITIPFFMGFFTMLQSTAELRFAHHGSRRHFSRRLGRFALRAAAGREQQSERPTLSFRITLYVARRQLASQSAGGVSYGWTSDGPQTSGNASGRRRD